MERLFLALSFIATGWMSLGFGIYLTYREDYVIAAGCFLISFCGFRQVYDNLKRQERCKELEKKMKVEIGRISNKLDEKNREISEKNREIWKLKNYDY